MGSRSAFNVAVTTLFCLAFTACGSQSASYAPAAAANGGTQPALNATSTALPILSDTSTSTAGIFLGAACGPKAKVSCANFATTFRHGIALGTEYTGWDTDLGTFISNQGMDAWPSQGTIPEITWQPNQSSGKVTYNGIISGAYDAYLKKSADELRAYGSPVFLRPFHEFNGNWYPWGLANQGADSAADTAFIAAWRHVYSIFHAQGATNVRFVWCFSDGSAPRAATNPWNNPPNAYPGDQYVDWIGFDAYNRGSATNGKPWRTFDQTIGQSYALAVSISANKPIMLAEGASNEYGDGGAYKAAWIDATFKELASASNPYPHLKAVTWFESDTNSYTYDSMSTSPVYNAFVNDIRWTNAGGMLDFRSNGNALAQITYP
jgi:hypothetical protein